MGLNGYNRGHNKTKRSQLHDTTKMLKVNHLREQGDLFQTDLNVNQDWYNSKCHGKSCHLVRYGVLSDLQLKMTLEPIPMT